MVILDHSKHPSSLVSSLQWWLVADVERKLHAKCKHVMGTPFSGAIARLWVPESFLKSCCLIVLNRSVHDFVKSFFNISFWLPQDYWQQAPEFNYAFDEAFPFVSFQSATL